MFGLRNSARKVHSRHFSASPKADRRAIAATPPPPAAGFPPGPARRAGPHRCRARPCQIWQSKDDIASAMSGINAMPTATALPLPAAQARRQLGRDFALARRRRGISTADMAARLLVSRDTLWRLAFQCGGSSEPTHFAPQWQNPAKPYSSPMPRKTPTQQRASARRCARSEPAGVRPFELRRKVAADIVARRQTHADALVVPHGHTGRQHSRGVGTAPTEVIGETQRLVSGGNWILRCMGRHCRRLSNGNGSARSAAASRCARRARSSR